MGMHQINFPVLTVRETVQPARLPDVRDAALFEIARYLTETTHHKVRKPSLTLNAIYIELMTCNDAGNLLRKQSRSFWR